MPNRFVGLPHPFLLKIVVVCAERVEGRSIGDGRRGVRWVSSFLVDKSRVD
jgi:hypothetical protein